ncbi:T7SS effector LXG polymorphic toxin [Paraliobacillus ryukyuensis]|uniref:T7SS effector LXG polymorphic toxin n=1 Tax=Paraliobacillus ryukyuensis TaxID=200904 RepID=UPI0009A8C00A|nr:T7SS effector LXG polymorphic toxin [Paraliobacillus ryukyuensis]
MGQRVDLSEVIDFSDEYYAYYHHLKDQIENVKAAIDQILMMDSFEGKAANNAKETFRDFHLKMLTQFEELLHNLLDNVDTHVNNFLSNVDGDEQTIIKENYLKDKKEVIQEDYQDLTDHSTKINKIIDSVSDISNASKPNFSPVVDDKETTLKDIDKVNRDLTEFTSIGTDRINQMDDLLSKIKSLLSEKSKYTNEGELALTKFINEQSTSIGITLHGLAQTRSFYTGAKIGKATSNGNILKTVEHQNYQTGKPSYRITANKGALEALGVEPDFRAQSDFNHRLPKNNSAWSETDLIRAQNNQTILKAADGNSWTNVGAKVKEIHPELQYFRDEIDVKHVGKSFAKGAYNGVKGSVADVNPATLFKNPTVLKSSAKGLGVLGVGLNYGSNLGDAHNDGLSGYEAHERAALDTTVDTVVSGAVQGGLTALGTAAIPIPGVGTAIGAGLGIVANYFLTKEWGKGKNKKTAMDVIKGWFH